MATPTTTTGGTMLYTNPSQEHRVGRMLGGLLGSENKKAKLQLTVDITKASGAKYHQTFRAKAWQGRDGHKMLTLDLGDGDWAAGTYATKVCHVDTTEGTVRPAKGMADKALLYAAAAALQYAFTGVAPNPANGTVQVEEASYCGCCGLTLTHPVSIELGIGPECAKRMGLEHHYKGTTLTGRAKRTRKQNAEAKAMRQEAGRQERRAAEAAAATAAPARGVVQSAMAELIEANEDELAQVSPAQRTAWLAVARAAMEQGAPVQPLGQWLEVYHPGNLYGAGGQLIGRVDMSTKEFLAPLLGGCGHGSSTELGCIACHRALITTVDQDIYDTQAAHNAAANARNYDLAEQLQDQLDELRKIKGKAAAEWEGNYGVQAWEARVQADPAARNLGRNDQLLVAHWCYVNHASVAATMQALGFEVAA